MSTLTLQLYALDEALATAWEEAFDGVSHVEIRRGSILDHDPSRDTPAALVSPANSFGYMCLMVSALPAPWISLRSFLGLAR